MYGKRYFKRSAAKPKARVVKRSFLRRKPMRRPFKNAIQKMPIAGIPYDRKLIKCRYIDTFTYATGSTPVTDNVISLNSFYDPDRVSFSHSPLGYSTWSALYNHYCVKFVNVRLTIQRQGTDNTMGALGLYLKNDNIPLTTGINQLMESGKIKYRFMPQGNTNYPVTITKRINLRKWFGVSNLDDNQELGAAINANPAKELWMHMCAFSPNGSYSPALQVSFQIDYFVELSEPKAIPY